MNRTAMHLVRRWWSSLSRRPPSAEDLEWVHGHLLSGEFALWMRMEVADRRHSVLVARRFVGLRSDSSRDEIAAALLHDVGKIESQLGIWSRVGVTLFGPRTSRGRIYSDHERIGVELCRWAGSSAATLAVLSDPGNPATEFLRRADDI